MPTPNRLSLSLVALLMGCTALSGSAQAGWFSSDDTKPGSDKKAIVKGEEVQPATTLDGSIRQAQLLRLAGQYPEAIRHLSQLMVVASDDGRVVTEYGKTLAAMGRAQESVDFLTRAQQLSPGDWTVYSALGVAYDQLGKHDQAQGAYEHALTLRPGEPSVLNNYALSRMLSKDPEGARKLIARAESAGGASDPKIARTIAMMKSLAPDTADKSLAAATPSQVAQNTPPQPAPRTPVAQHSMPAAQVASNQSAPFVNIPAPPVSAPRLLMPAANSVIEPSHQQPTNAVVMQRVPVDPLAGPVLPRVPVATHAPRALARAEKPEAPKPQPAKVADAKPAPVKTAATEALDLQAQDLQKKADAIAKQLNGKPAAIAAAKAEASKAPAPLQAAKPQPSKVAEAKPAPVKTAAKPKDTIPGLRLSANAY
jgi:Flp pilus assembly protein TadD